ncbi:MAG: purine-nucleoside phosphorylase [Planctomycetota bacterium]
MTTLSEQLDAIKAHVSMRCALVPRVAILLGTGLGNLASRVEVQATIPYDEIPGMPMPTADSHHGTLVLGNLAGVPVAAFSGRLHAYEGHPLGEVVLPVRLGKWLGATTLIMGSAVGGMNPRYQIGDITVLSDHLNLTGVNPLVGENDDRVGPRWPDMIDTYDAKLRALALRVATGSGITLHEAVYAGVLGPNLETRAEYRWLRSCGADVVGMSTVPEAIAAVHCGLRTLAFAIVTDRCIPEELEPTDISKIIAAANKAEPVLARLICDLLPQV